MSSFIEDFKNTLYEAIYEVLIENAKWNSEKHPRHPKGSIKGGQFAKVHTGPNEILTIDKIIGLRNSLNTNLTYKDCEGVLKGKKIYFDYASAKFKILVYGYDDYKICDIISIE